MKKALSILCATVLLCTGMASGAAASADAAVSGQVFDMSSCAFDKMGTWKGENAVLDSLSYDAASGLARISVSYETGMGRQGGVGLLNDSLKLEAGTEKNRFVKIRLRVDAHAKQFAFDNFAFHYKTAADGVVSDWTSNFGSPALMTGLHDSEEFITAVFDLGLAADVELNTLRLDINTKDPTDGMSAGVGGEKGSLYIDYIGFFDTKAAADAYAGGKDISTVYHFSQFAMGTWAGESPVYDSLQYDAAAKAGRIGVTYEPNPEVARYGAACFSGKNMVVPVGAGKNQFVKLRIRSDEKSKVYAFDKLMIHYTLDGDAGWQSNFSNLDKAAGLHGSTDYVDVIVDLGFSAASTLKALRFDVTTNADSEGHTVGVGGENGNLYIEYVGLFNSAADAAAFTLNADGGDDGDDGEQGGDDGKGEEGGDDGKEEDKPETSAQLDMRRLSNGVAYNFANGLKNGWSKENPASVIEADATEKAIRIDGKTGAQLLFEPGETFAIGADKNRYMKVRIKGDASLYRFVSYFIVGEDAADAVFGPTLRLIKDLKINPDGYVDIVMDMYEKGEGYGSDWDGTLRKFRLDMHQKDGTTVQGELFVQYIGFFDTKEAAQAFDGDFTDKTGNTQTGVGAAGVAVGVTAVLSAAALLFVTAKKRGRA